MPVTTRGVWTPADSDDWDLTVDLAAMALSIDSALATNESNAAANSWFGSGTIAQRDALLPPVRKTNYVWRDSATGLTFYYNGSAWVNTTEVINLGRISNSSGTQSIGATDTDVTGLSITLTLPSASTLRFNVQVTTYSTSNSDVSVLTVTNGTIKTTATRGVNSSSSITNTGNSNTWSPEIINVPAGTHTFKVQVAKAAGAGSNNISVAASSLTPNTFSIDRIA